jgi:hypothetical protein
MKINVFDTGLESRGGHHFDFDRTLMRNLAQAGHEVHFYGPVGMDDEVVDDLSGYGAVTRLLRLAQNAPSEPVERYAEKLDSFLRNSDLLAEDLGTVAEADLWIWPSMMPYDLQAAALSKTRAAVAGCIHFDPGIEASTVTAMTWRIAFLNVQRKGVRVTAGSIEPELRHRFTPIVPGGKFLVLPHPYDGPPLAEPKTALRRVGFFGHQRIERGVEFIPPLAKVLVAEGYEVTVHDTNGGNTRDLPGVDMLQFVDDIAVPISACDLVVLPYTVDQYRRKGSGILGQCMTIGIPVIGPFGTIPGRIIEQYGVGPLFSEPTAQALYNTIKFANRHYATYAETAFRVAQRFSRQNGGARFAEAFVTLAELGKA